MAGSEHDAIIDTACGHAIGNRRAVGVRAASQRLRVVAGPHVLAAAMSEFVAYVQELFTGFGAVSARAMFGGYGLYHDGVMFAVVIDDGLYLKVDAQTQGLFEAEGCAPFVYTHATKPLTMSYWSVPDAALDSPQAMLPWARLAYAAALRKPRPDKRGAKGKTPRSSG